MVVPRIGFVFSEVRGRRYRVRIKGTDQEFSVRAPWVQVVRGETKTPAPMLRSSAFTAVNEGAAVRATTAPLSVPVPSLVHRLAQANWIQQVLLRAHASDVANAIAAPASMPIPISPDIFKSTGELALAMTGRAHCFRTVVTCLKPAREDSDQPPSKKPRIIEPAAI